MNDLIKWGLIGAGAYLVWSQYSAPAVAATTTTGTAPAAAPLTPAMSDIVTLSNVTASQLLAAAQAGGALPASQLFTPSQWNFYLTQLTGIPGPPLATYLGTDATQTVPLGTYWAAVGQWAVDNLHAEQAAAAAAGAGTGVSGLAGLRGLGCSAETLAGLARRQQTPPMTAGRYDFDETGWS